MSYGHTWVADTATTVGLVPVGYGDGVPRHAGNHAEVQVGGKRRGIRGRVCMDQFVVGLDGDLPEPGADVVLFGPGSAGEPTAQDWAVACDTISYEIVTRIGGRMSAAPPPHRTSRGRHMSRRTILGATVATAGAVGLAAVGAGVGLARRRNAIVDRAPDEDPDFGSLRSDPVTVVASDGVPLHVEVDEVDEVDTPRAAGRRSRKRVQPTVVFCHGYALEMDCWHFQRQHLRGRVRAVFYDQRSHGRSGPLVARARDHRPAR